VPGPTAEAKARRSSSSGRCATTAWSGACTRWSRPPMSAPIWPRSLRCRRWWSGSGRPIHLAP